ncbi:MAG TPA: RNA-protein complex protein Nop10 [Methanoregulaceae archaeon]|nr:RNA-protein complex protein Nop10 [Methanoregulaceae archaeon]HOV66728.1 RNA-protein complex protein Nop10 [Methanoregulaceae archaeon]HQJ88882.1 RNA-protein complex protein Nop10 [Methanoregulaceae archaeon]
MKGLMRFCRRDRVYTLGMLCPVCGEPVGPAHPPRFSPQDRYGRLRRMVR